MRDIVGGLTSADPTAPGPCLIHDGLAAYARGTGEPLLLMPYPHGFTSGPITGGSLATLLTRRGRCVVSFDPPGAHTSTRPPRVDMPEMMACATEALDALHIQGPVDTIGHSMGGLCTQALAIDFPERAHPRLRRTLRPTVPGGMQPGASLRHPWRADRRLRAQRALPARGGAYHLRAGDG